MAFNQQAVVNHGRAGEALQRCVDTRDKRQDGEIYGYAVDAVTVNMLTSLRI